MFGYVRPLRRELRVREWEDYQAAYCGLCHSLKATCGWRARYVLNYDFTFLALLLDDGGQLCREKRRCGAHPFKKRSCVRCGAMEPAAEKSVILACYKLRDAVADETFWKRQGARLALWLLRGPYRRAARRQPEFDRHVAQCLGALGELEEARCPSLDRPADTFARLLRGAAPQAGDETVDRPMDQLLYHLGRWIYLLDAWDDLAADRAAGRYNPVEARFEGAVDEDYVQTTLRHSLSLCQSAFQLLPATRWHGILENILYLGLPTAQKQVFAGTWMKKVKEI